MFHLFGTASFWADFRVTMYETTLGWLIGAAAGLLVGLALGRWRTMMSVFDPYLTFANAMPKIALAPFFILWFGVGTNSKIVLAITIVFFIVEVPTQAAARQIDPDLVLVVETMATTPLQQFRKVVVPSLVPTIFGALRLGAVYALLSVVLGEFMAAKLGLGQALLTSTNNFDMATAFALLIVLALLAVIISGLLGLVEHRLLRWQDVGQGRGRSTAMWPTSQAA
jgi:NitT/TauT family transport system permease protein